LTRLEELKQKRLEAIARLEAAANEEFVKQSTRQTRARRECGYK
jgi:hypothetical protein